MPLPPTWNCCNPFIWNRRQCDLRQSNRENTKNSHSIGFYFGFNPIRLVFPTDKPLINHARTPNNIRARTHTRRRKISTTRPPQPHNALCVCSLRVWSITLTRGVRPPFDHPSTTSHLPLPSQKQLDQNSRQYTILHVLTTGNILVKRWTRLLHNIWHHYFPIFETICFQRWKDPYLTLDNTLI